MSDGQGANATAFELEVLPYTPGVFPIAMSQSGGGRIVPDLDGQNIRTGERRAVVAVPDAGYVFAGWSGSVTSGEPKLTFTMQPRMVLQATFILNPWVAIQGTYAGLLREDAAFRHDTAGAFNVTTTDRGRCTGRLTLGGDFKFSQKEHISNSKIYMRSQGRPKRVGP